MSDDLNRRSFLLTTVAVACAAVTCDHCLAQAADEKEGKEEKQENTSSDATTVNAGPLTGYAKDGVFDKFIKKPDRVLLVRKGEKLYALSSICSHKKATLRITDGVINCPSHKSRFTNDGKPTKGPAKLPLTRFALSTDDKGNVIVDKTKTFEEKDWEKDGAFLKVG
jgi:Rieske Fe-S protein